MLESFMLITSLVEELIDINAIKSKIEKVTDIKE